jgi:hypothetical protein
LKVGLAGRYHVAGQRIDLLRDAEWQGYEIESPRIELLLPAGSHDWLLLSDQYRPTPVHFATDQVTVRLEEWSQLTIAMAAMPELPPKTELQVRAELVDAPSLRYFMPGDRGESDSMLAPEAEDYPFQNGRATVPVGDGMLRLKLRLTGDGKDYEFTGHSPATVLSTAGNVTLQVPAAEWARATAALQPDPPANSR